MLSIDTNLSWMLNITIINSHINRQPKLPRVRDASPPRIPPTPTDPPNTEVKVPLIIKAKDPNVMRIAPIMYMTLMKFEVMYNLKSRKSSKLNFNTQT